MYGTFMSTDTSTTMYHPRLPPTFNVKYVQDLDPDTRTTYVSRERSNILYRSLWPQTTAIPGLKKSCPLLWYMYIVYIDNAATGATYTCTTENDSLFRMVILVIRIFI